MERKCNIYYIFIFKASKARFKKLFLVFDSALEMD